VTRVAGRVSGLLITSSAHISAHIRVELKGSQVSNPTQEQPGESVPLNPYAGPAEPYPAVPAQPYGTVPAQPGFVADAPAPKKSSTGKIIAIAAVAVIVIVGGIVAIMAMPGGTKTVGGHPNPGCAAAESYIPKWSAKTKTDAANVFAIKADVQDAVTELNKDAAKSTTAGTKAAISKLSADMQAYLDAFNSGTIPPASAETQIEADGAAITTACGH
jgi:hypothetical protein